MSRGKSFSRFNAGARSFLEPDVGPVDDEGCSIGPCDDDAVYRVPWPQFGGDVAYCPYHLARYRSSYPKEFQSVQQHVDDDLSAYATRGDRFLNPGGRSDEDSRRSVPPRRPDSPGVRALRRDES